MVVPDLDEPAEMRLLVSCTEHGVSVSFVPDPAGYVAAAAGHPAVGRPAHALSGEAQGTLTRAAVDALTGLFPRRRIWRDHNGWHARRRGGHLQVFRPGAPAFHVRADSATELAAQLAWLRAAGGHAPQGCATGKLADEHRIVVPAAPPAIAEFGASAACALLYAPLTACRRERSRTAAVVRTGSAVGGHRRSSYG